ncbi:MAG: aminopeptidase [Desulfobacteraceae bacterium 4572_187]|nr:MAG: aminopeptidase [Desulfobacteraceae bacterium 4572_187]
MFTEKQLDRYADVLLWAMKKARTGKFKKNDVVAIRYNTPSIRLAEILNAKLLGIGMNPVLRALPSPTMERNHFELSNNRQLVFLPPGEKKLYTNLNGSIFLNAPESITHLKNIDPKKIGKIAVSRKIFRDILSKREEQGLFGWTLCIFPTKKLAQHAGLSMKEYTRQIIKSCFLNKISPISHWEQIFKNAISIKKWLNSLNVKFYHIESENVDLKISPGEKRRWIGLSGHNMPSFEIFLSPDWRGTTGVYFADQPSYRSGNFVKNVRLEFKKGSAVKISAKKGEAFVKNQLSMDKGANKLGEFSLTDKRFSKINVFMANTLFDENYGGKYGNCHIAVGASYSDSYSGDLKKLSEELKKKLGFNDSALHWDLVNTEKKRVSANLTSGKIITIYENGRFLY